jgi:hypothetical protein
MRGAVRHIEFEALSGQISKQGAEVINAAPARHFDCGFEGAGRRICSIGSDVDARRRFSGLLAFDRIGRDERNRRLRLRRFRRRGMRRHDSAEVVGGVPTTAFRLAWRAVEARCVLAPPPAHANKHPLSRSS